MSNCKENGRAQCQQGIGLVMHPIDLLLECHPRIADVGGCGIQAKLIDAHIHVIIEIGFDQFGGVRLYHPARLAIAEVADNASSLPSRSILHADVSKWRPFDLIPTWRWRTHSVQGGRGWSL